LDTVQVVARNDRLGAEGPIDLLGGSGVGPLWGMASTDLNATLLVWPPHHEVAEHLEVTSATSERVSAVSSLLVEVAAAALGGGRGGGVRTAPWRRTRPVRESCRGRTACARRGSGQ